VRVLRRDAVATDGKYECRFCIAGSGKAQGHGGRHKKHANKSKGQKQRRKNKVLELHHRGTESESLSLTVCMPPTPAWSCTKQDDDCASRPRLPVLGPLQPSAAAAASTHSAHSHTPRRRCECRPNHWNHPRQQTAHLTTRNLWQICELWTPVVTNCTNL
jgi:hypothetical protein